MPPLPDKKMMMMIAAEMKARSGSGGQIEEF